MKTRAIWREVIDLLAPLVQAANVDLKSFDDAFYRKLCGARLAPVKETIADLHARLGDTDVEEGIQLLQEVCSA